MRANPGGVVAPEDVVGRDDLVAHLWRVLEVQSIVLTSERRVGKTSVLRKMMASPGAGRVCFMRDVEGYRSPTEFIEGIYEDVQDVLSRKERARQALFTLLQKIGGTEIKDIKLPTLKPHWKSILSALFEDIFGAETRPVIFLWDELPLFLYNVRSNSGQHDAMELLDFLRALRQKHHRLRMVFAGSVGIHQVIGSLRQHGYANDPTNDMATIEVPPLSPDHGLHLARLLLEGEKIAVFDDPAVVGTAISEAAGHIPYYIHYLISRVSNTTRRIRRSEVSGCLQQLITDPNDPAHFHYYQTRLTTYYGPDDARVAFVALDAVASQPKPVSFAELSNLVRHKVDVDEEALRRVLRILMMDHYLVRNADDTFSFRYSIVQNWWVYTRR